MNVPDQCRNLRLKKKEINALPISNAGGDEKLIINFIWPKEHDLIVKIGINNIIYLIQIYISNKILQLCHVKNA